jgi:hypothetical protein
MCVDRQNRAFGDLPCLIRSRLCCRVVSSLPVPRENGRSGARYRTGECEFQMAWRDATGLRTTAGASVALQDFLEELADLLV